MYLTVAETPVFQSCAAKIWSKDELDQFVNWIALNPFAGDVIPGSGGLRKVRWAAIERFEGAEKCDQPKKYLIRKRKHSIVIFCAVSGR